MRWVITALAGLACCIDLSAEVHPGRIRGAALDLRTGSPVPNVNLSIEGANIGAASDSSGEFIIGGLPPGTYHLTASALGYKSQTVTELQVLPGRSTQVEFQLEPVVSRRRDVVVRAAYFHNDQYLPTSSRSLGYEEVRRAPGAAEDIQRAIQALPGVSNRNDQNNEIVVRGGSPSENLTVIDGIEIDNINHFPDQSSSGGPISAVNTEFLREVTFSTGGFSARYGDRLSSVLNLELREGARDQFSGEIETSIAGLGFNLEGGILNGKGSYLTSYRKSYLDLLQVPIGLTAVPHFWDAQIKAVYDLDHRTKLSLLGLYGRDMITIEAEKPDAWSRGAESVDHRGYNLAVGGRLRRVWGSGYSDLVAARTEAYYDQYVYEIETDSLTGDIRKIGTYSNLSTETTHQLHLSWTGALRKTDQLSAGVSLKLLAFSHDRQAEAEYVDLDLDEDGQVDTTVVEGAIDVNIRRASLKYGGFAQYRLRAGEWLSLQAGVRVDGFEYSGRRAEGLRFSAQWEPHPRTTVKIAAGSYFQSHPLVVYTVDPANKTLRHSRSDHYILGFSYQPTAASLLNVEAYYKDYRYLPFSEMRLREDDPLFYSNRYLARGRKWARGVEFFAQQKLSANWYGTFSYSYGIADFDDTRSSHPADYDFRHVGTIVFGYKFDGARARQLQRQWYGIWAYALPISGDELTASTRFRYVSGRPYTPYIWTDAGPEVAYHWERLATVNSARYPDYSRWDVRWDSRWYFGGNSIAVFVEVQNILDRANIAEYIYTDNGEISIAYQFRLFFVGGVRFGW